MSFQQKEMSGALFKNAKKEKDSHPNMTGSATIDGVEYWVSAWTKDGDKGKWQSLAFKKKDAIKTPQADAKKRPAQDDSIPF
jgi:hypothetical protein